ncbi:MAG: hypothetical protein F4X82_01590 [Candidatus Spechtbacteria bacterium SB0662_bin_43]|uniref:Uncharacterized protein n=1 Tax=Candidatus Spechtbacteria bacterium SB0662_bin_43 TaxID=2604897 RepID=A0A845DC15_9BACT|nr:hypothetical protein [Candidatus Spechtbacteria bacterium SB0662_bin_43]
MIGALLLFYAIVVFVSDTTHVQEVVQNNGGFLDDITLMGILQLVIPLITLWVVLRREKTIDAIQQSIGNLIDRVSSIEGWIQGFTKQEGIVQGSSPMTLTNVGKELVEQTKIENYLNEHFDALLEEFKDANTEYDIQKISETTLHGKRDDIENSLTNEAKNYLYQNNFRIAGLIVAMSVMLRDKVIEKKGLGQNKEKIQK